MDDLQLLRAYCDHGDVGALSRLVERHRRAVFGTCLRQLGSPPDAEDATQEVFLALLENAGQVRTNVGGWLHRCALHVCHGSIRARRFRRRRERERVWADGVEADLVLHERLAVLDQLTRELGPEERLLIDASCTRELPQRELAAELGITQQTVSKRFSRLCTALRQSMRPYMVPAVVVTFLLLLRRKAYALAPQRLALAAAESPSGMTVRASLKVAAAAIACVGAISADRPRQSAPREAGAAPAITSTRDMRANRLPQPKATAEEQKPIAGTCTPWVAVTADATPRQNPRSAVATASAGASAKEPHVTTYAPPAHPPASSSPGASAANWTPRSQNTHNADKPLLLVIRRHAEGAPPVESSTLTGPDDPHDTGEQPPSAPPETCAARPGPTGHPARRPGDETDLALLRTSRDLPQWNGFDVAPGGQIVIRLGAGRPTTPEPPPGPRGFHQAMVRYPPPPTETASSFGLIAATGFLWDDKAPDGLALPWYGPAAVDAWATHLPVADALWPPPPILLQWDGPDTKDASPWLSWDASSADQPLLASPRYALSAAPPSAAPEPGTLAMMAGAAMLLMRSRRRT